MFLMFFFFKFYVFLCILKTFIILTWSKEPKDKCSFMNLFFSLANELTDAKSFCLRPTTVFVLFYFSTWLP